MPTKKTFQRPATKVSRAAAEVSFARRMQCAVNPSAKTTGTLLYSVLCDYCTDFNVFGGRVLFNRLCMMKHGCLFAWLLICLHLCGFLSFPFIAFISNIRIWLNLGLQSEGGDEKRGWFSVVCS